MVDTFTEIKRTYFGETKVFECTLLERARNEIALLYKIQEPTNFIGIGFAPDAVSFGYYWLERNYNVYHWKNSRGETMLYYFNVAKDTRIGGFTVEWTDMIVDVAVLPDGTVRVLDEDEIPKGIDKNDASLIESTKEEIVQNLNSLTRDLESRTARLMRSVL